MAYVVNEPRVGVQPLATVSTTQKHPIGDRVKGYDSAASHEEAWFVYAQASVALLQYDAAWIKDNGKAIKTNEAAYKNPGMIAFPQVAFAADEFGWMCISGAPLVRLTSSTEKDVPLYVNASDGVLSGATSSAQVLGLSAVTSVTTTVNAVTCIANFPILKWGAGLSEI